MSHDIPNLAFTKDGKYDLRSKAKRAAAMEACLKVIASIPQAYYSRGPEFVRDEMQRCAVELLNQLRPMPTEEDDVEARRPSCDPIL